MKKVWCHSHKLILDHSQKNSSLLSTIKIRNKLIKSVKAACQWYKLDPGKQKEWQAR